jgi:hypothetical protein
LNFNETAGRSISFDRTIGRFVLGSFVLGGIQSMNEEPKPTRTVQASVVASNASELPANRILSVELAEGEDVNWVWSFTRSGEKYVSGYQIVNEGESAEEKAILPGNSTRSVQ